ncbi:MAG: FAD/NAD(P)-binding protein [Candidatus Aenigmarchaeota archaeon]|nr:FAD/NAD(P)-binding protein [Candidatus Aenigmarchaeota archaeon]
MINGNEESYRPALAAVTSVLQENARIRTLGITFRLDAERKSFSFNPGQFVMITLPGIGEAPFSMCSSPKEKGHFELSIRNLGNVTDGMFRLRKGDVVGVRGPYGHGYPVQEMKGRDIVLVAGGIGFPPLASVVEHVIANRADYGKVWVLYGVKDYDDVIYRQRMKRWSKAKDLEVRMALETPCSKWKGCVGVVTKLFNKLKIDAGNTVGLSCGPPIMLKFVTLGFEKLGIRDGDIFISLERLMQCGIGKCGHCNIGNKYVCTDGPVFRYTDIKNMAEEVW